MSKDKNYLGDIRTEVVGTQYYDGEIRPKDPVGIEREPGNDHDPNAIRVMSPDSEQVGHLPRRMAAWLAPLLDAGKVRVDGRCETGDHGETTAVRLRIYLCPKGKSVLQRVKAPANEVSALHEVIRRAFREAKSYEDPDLIRSLGKRLSVLARHGVLPETQLLLALFPHIADVIRRRQSGTFVEGARAALAALKLGPMLSHGSLTLYPLLGQNGHEPAYALLQDAIKSETAEVSEINESGSVSSLLVTNRGIKPLLIPEGDILIGAKQDRVVNITIIVAANSKLIIPVSCVEQGRWHHVSRNFEVAFSAPPSLRRDKVRSVQRNRAESAEAHSDQGQVWESVESSLHAFGVESETESMADLYRTQRDRLDESRKHLTLPEGATGFVMASGSRILGVDLFDSSQTMSRVWARVSEGYFVEALGDAKARGKATRKQAQEFLDRVCDELGHSADPIGEGTELVINGKDVSGAGVWYQDRLCHLSAFMA